MLYQSGRIRARYLMDYSGVLEVHSEVEGVLPCHLVVFESYFSLGRRETLSRRTGHIFLRGQTGHFIIIAESPN
jgi:hypothetical protein